MDNLHSVIRTIHRQTKQQPRDHLTVFREFLGHLDRIGRKTPPRPPAKGKGGRRR